MIASSPSISPQVSRPTWRTSQLILATKLGLFFAIGYTTALLCHKDGMLLSTFAPVLTPPSINSRGHVVNSNESIAGLTKQNTAQHLVPNNTSLSESANDVTHLNTTTLPIPSWTPIELTEAMLHSGSFFIYKFPPGYRAWGLASNLMNLFSKIMYLDELYDRSPIAVEADFGYRRNSTHGVLTGYFTPRFPVLDRHDQYALAQPYMGNRSLAKFVTNVFWTSATNRKNTTIWVTGVHTYRFDIQDMYNHRPNEFYEKMVHHACPHLQFNDETKHEIQQIRKEYGLDFDFGASTSVAFHVRRTDKVKETQPIRGEDYVEKMLQVIRGVSPLPTIDHCYVATDDVAAVMEIKSALKRANISCTVLALQTSKQIKKERMNSTSALALLTDLDILQEATYFIGTFSSNVGNLAAILRGCHRSNRPHFAHSYDVFDGQFSLW